MKENKHIKEINLNSNQRAHRNASTVQQKTNSYKLDTHSKPAFSSDILRIRERQVKKKARDFPGGAVDKNPPANAGDKGSIPGRGRSHMPRSN